MIRHWKHFNIFVSLSLSFNQEISSAQKEVFMIFTRTFNWIVCLSPVLLSIKDFIHLNLSITFHLIPIISNLKQVKLSRLCMENKFEFVFLAINYITLVENIFDDLTTLFLRVILLNICNFTETFFYFDMVRNISNFCHFHFHHE